MGLEKNGRKAKEPNEYMDNLRRIKKQLEDSLISEFARFEDETGLCITDVNISRVGTPKGGSYIAGLEVRIEL